MADSVNAADQQQQQQQHAAPPTSSAPPPLAASEIPEMPPAASPEWLHLVMRLIERVVALETWRSEVVIRLDRFDGRFSQLDRHMAEQDKTLNQQNATLANIERILHGLHAGGLLAIKVGWGIFTLFAAAAVYFVVQAMSWGQQVAIVLAFLAAAIAAVLAWATLSSRS